MNYFAVFIIVFFLPLIAGEYLPLNLENQLDMFQVIMATNRIETLDPALIRPGRIDRKIEFPLPDEKTKRRIFQIHTSRMSMNDDVNIEEYVMAKDELSGADIKVCFTLL